MYNMDMLRSVRISGHYFEQKLELSSDLGVTKSISSNAMNLVTLGSAA
jgi:hypothetical protein